VISAVIVAGGKGQRMGGALAKQYLLLDGFPVLTRTLLAFAELGSVDRICLAGEIESSAGESASGNFTASTAAVQVAARQMAGAAAKNERERAAQKQLAPKTSAKKG